MAVLQMQRISICALKKDRKQILELLQRRGAVELTDLPLQDQVFGKPDTQEQKSLFEKAASTASQAVEVLNEYVPEKSSMFAMFEGRRAISAKEYDALCGKRDEISETASHLVSLSKKIAENRAELVKLQTQLDQLAPWAGLDVSMRFTGTRTTAAFIGSFAEPLTLEELYRRIAELAPEVQAVNIDLISQSNEQTCIMAVVPRADAPALEEALRSMGFMRPPSPSKLPPSEQIGILSQQAKEAEVAVQSAQAEIASQAKARESLLFLSDYYTMRAERYQAIGCLSQSRSTFLLTGYIPKPDAAALEAALTSRFDLAVELEDPGEEEEVPCALRNNGFAEPVEGVLESYGLPLRSEIDPTPIMACFYYFLFGLMFSDFGYGALLCIGTGLVLLKFKNIEPGLRKMVKMFFFCGISTAAWGIVFSSYFGDVVNVVSRTFLGHEVSIPPLWFLPLNDPMKLLVFSMAVGVVHLFTGLGIQLYLHIKHRDYKSALCIGSVFGWVAAAGAVGIVFTNGDSANPAVRFAQGLYELYNVTGYLSDILSYSRLLALGLATGVVGSVINQMGSMGGKTVPGVILFVLVFLVGHILNFGIELLGAYVHCNRLQFVEFFGKFYEGGSRPFSPFAAHTKYFKFKEEN